MFRNSHRASLALSILAVVLATTGTAVAAKLITGKQIKDNSITSKDVRGIKSADVKNGTLKSVDFSSEAKAALQGDAGPKGADGAKGETGPTGPAGAAGKDGAAGPTGPSDATLVSKDTFNVSVIPSSKLVLSKDLPAGNYSYTASFALQNTDDAAGDYVCTLTQNGTDNNLDIPVAETKATLAVGAFAPMSLTGAVARAGASTLKLRCDSPTAGIDNAKLTSVNLVVTKVGSVS